MLKHFQIFITLFGFVLALSCGKGGGSSTAPQETIPISPSSGIVQLFQNVYLYENLQSTLSPQQAESIAIKQTDQGLYSGIGYVKVDTDKLSNLGIDLGFLQIFLDNGEWVAKNMPLFAGVGTLGGDFKLADEVEYGQAINSIQAYVVITPEPLDLNNPSITPSDFDEWSISPREVNAEGREEPVLYLPEVGTYEPESVGAKNLRTKQEEDLEKIFENVNTKVIEKREASRGSSKVISCLQKKQKGELWTKYTIQAANNQCGPAAAADSLAWLKDKWGIQIPHEHKKGLRGDNTLVGKLDELMNRIVNNRAKGDPIYDSDFIEGKLKYMLQNNICLVVKHQDDVLTDVSVTEGGHTMTSKDKGYASFKFLCEEVCKGQDVEVGFSYLPGGHWVRVVGCGILKRESETYPFILYAHDARQTNRDPDDKKGVDVDLSYVRSKPSKWTRKIGGKTYSTTGIAAAGKTNPEVDPKDGLKGIIDIVVSESPPEAEGKTVKDVCPWMVPPPVNEKCSGVEHGAGESYIWVCFEGNFQAGDVISVDFSGLGSWSTEFTSSVACVCTSRQTIYSYGTYSYSGIYIPVSGSTYEFSGSISVDSGSRACSCD